MINSPDSFGDTIKSVVWDQFINQIGAIAGEDFTKENQGLPLDLRDSAHIQTTDNFAKGRIATHNDKIDYQERYDNWQSKLQHNEDGTVKTYTNRAGSEQAILRDKSVREPFDKDRPSGSADRNTDMDHTVSAGEIIRDPEANAHLSENEQIAFANSEKNLQEMNKSHNRSKKDKKMTDWLDNPNSKGQKLSEIFDDLDEDLENQYREKDAEARGEYEKVKKEGEKRSFETGKQSQREEAFRIGGKALRAVLMRLLADLVKTIIQKLVKWLRTGRRKWSTFMDSIKEAIHKFISELKSKLITATDTLFTTIASAIFGPIVSVFKKVGMFLKQGIKSIKEAIDYIKKKENKGKPLSILLLEVGKIIVAGITAGGALILGEVIEKGLMSIPIFAFQIPLLGSLASLLGIFFGALISGLIGALIINLIDRAIAKKKVRINRIQTVNAQAQVMATQRQLIQVADVKMEVHKQQSANAITSRHQEANEIIHASFERMFGDAPKSPSAKTENDDALNDLFDEINSI